MRYRGGRFLITGGMGGIGLRVAEFLADEGCARLTLVGRTVPERGEARERLDRLAGRCDLDVVAADVRSLGTVLSGPFDGVFHAAGVLRDGLARSLTPDRVDAVLGPKVGGAHALADLVSGGEHPGFVVLFSSIAAVRANLGQSAYAAANGYLDGYAARRRSEGLPWYSLGWGLWTVGMGEAVAPRPPRTASPRSPRTTASPCSVRPWAARPRTTYSPPRTRRTHHDRCHAPTPASGRHSPSPSGRSCTSTRSPPRTTC